MRIDPSRVLESTPGEARLLELVPAFLVAAFLCVLATNSDRADAKRVALERRTWVGDDTPAAMTHNYGSWRVLLRLRRVFTAYAAPGGPPHKAGIALPTVYDVAWGTSGAVVALLSTYDAVADVHAGRIPPLATAYDDSCGGSPGHALVADGWERLVALATLVVGACAVAGGDPVNGGDPTGLGGAGGLGGARGCGGNPPGLSPAQEALHCWAVLAERDGVTGQTLQAAGGTATACEGSFSPTTPGVFVLSKIPGLGFSFSLPPIVIPVPPFILTLQDDVTVAGPDSAVDVTLANDGSFTIGSGGSTANFSSAGALNGLTDGNWTFSGNSITYTTSETHNVGPDQVTADYAATLEQGTDHLPPGALGRDVEHGAEVAGAVGGGVVVLWWVAKLLSPLCGGPFVGVCAVAG